MEACVSAQFASRTLHGLGTTEDHSGDFRFGSGLGLAVTSRFGRLSPETFRESGRAGT
jgi:hypothetical protein